MPVAVQGILDLTSWNFASAGPIPLNGAWEFYWQRHLTPTDFAHAPPPLRTGWIRVPGVWNGYQVAGQPISGDGYATYRLQVRLGDPRERLALKLLDMATAFTIYVNGQQLLTSGVPGKTPHTTTPRFEPQIIDFRPIADHLDIVVVVSNFHHRKGGVWEAIYLGSVDDIRAMRERILLVNLILFGSIAIIGLYHLSLFALRPGDQSPLYFGLFCLIVDLRILTTGERYVMQLVPTLEWEMLLKVSYLTFYLGVPAFGLFIRALFVQEMGPRVYQLILGVSALFSAAILCLPARIYTHTTVTFQLFTIIASVYSFYVLLLAAMRKREGAQLCLTGFAVLFLTVLNDILYANLLVPTGYLIHVGLIIFVFLQALLLAQRSANAFATVDHQRLALAQSNRAYAQELQERKRVEIALRQSRSDLAEAQRLAHIGNWEWEIETGHINGSEEVFRLLGLAPQQRLSYSLIRSMIAPDDQQSWGQAVQAVLDTGNPMQIDCRVLRTDGDLHWLHSEAQVVRDEAGQAVKMFGTFQDITERKQREADQLQASRMESIGVLAGGIAHEFNNVLAAIIGFAELATLDMDPSGPTYRHLQSVLTAGRRAKELVQQILTFSRKNHPVRQPVSLPALAQEVLRLVRASVPTTIAIASHIDPEAGEVLADPTHLHQILMNLCTNAAYAMRQTGGTLELTITCVEVHGAGAATQALSPGPYVRLTVRDTGDGIPPEVLEHIFEPFFTTKEVGEGTGMGLAIIHGIVTSYNGAVSVESTPGVGSIFTVDLPRLAPTNQRCPDPAPETQTPMPQGRARILFVDDEASLARLGQEALSLMGYEVVSVLDSGEALNLFRAMPQQFDLVVSDQTMPVMTGTQLAQELRQIREDIPIVLCTGFSHMVDADRARVLGINAFCMKPLDMRELAHQIDHILGH
jgi:PAS domain S-box-containing protein